jgi:hypothetical protein
MMINAGSARKEAIMKQYVVLALALSAAPSALLAQTITGGLTLSFTQQDSSGAEMDTKGLDGRMETDFGNGFTFGLDVGVSKMSQNGSTLDVDGEFFGIDGGYRFGNGMTAGLFVDRLTLGLGGLIDVTLKTQGLSVGYETDSIDVEAFLGNSSLSLPLPFDVDNIGLTASYTGTPGLEVGGSFLRAEISAGGFSEDIDFKGLAASYVMKDSFILFGGMSRTDLAGLTDLDTIGLGVGYDLSSVAGFASTVSLEAANTDFGPSDIDTLRLGLTLPMGKKGPMVPLNSVADSVLNPRNGALNAALTSAF